jgi:hypothetical protein
MSSERERDNYAYTGTNILNLLPKYSYSGADKSLARPGRKQATATEDFEFHIYYL